MSGPRKIAEGFRVISNKLFMKHRPRRDRRVQKGQYTAIEAFLSMHMDMHTHGRLLSERAYSGTWRRTRKWVRSRMDEFRNDAIYQQQGDQLGVQLGDHGGDQLGDHIGDQLSRAETAGSSASGDQTGDQVGDHIGDQPGDQIGTTSKRREENEKRRERGNGADAPLSALSDLIDLVSRERPGWNRDQCEVWLRANLARIGDAVDAKSPKNRDAAIRAAVRSWARREKDTPPVAIRSQPQTTRDCVMAHLGTACPDQESFSEEHIQAHWKHFEEQCGWGPYEPPDLASDAEERRP